MKAFHLSVLLAATVVSGFAQTTGTTTPPRTGRTVTGFTANPTPALTPNPVTGFTSRPVTGFMSNPIPRFNQRFQTAPATVAPLTSGIAGTNGGFAASPVAPAIPRVITPIAPVTSNAVPITPLF